LAIINASERNINSPKNNLNLDIYNILTEREKEVLKVVSKGKTSKEIGLQLNISSLTVDKHKKNIKEKTNLSTIGELVNFALSIDI
jgi:two-component system response regulator NreC